jgi:hypothetical protein
MTMASPVGAARESIEAPPSSMALLQVPSGRIAYRLALPDGEPWEIAHEGYMWRWSHRCASGVTYQRGRVAEVEA